MKLVVGLGNPGKEYENTRHNVGFTVVDNYLNNEKLSKKFNSEYVIKTINNEKVIFLKPLTYMNLSGEAVYNFANYYNIDSKDILIIRDDLDLEIGTAKIKYNSSSGGDNGVKSIISKLKTQEFTQLKIGISKTKDKDTKEYVLGKFSNVEKEKINRIIDMSSRIIDCFIEFGPEFTMNKYNGELK